MSATSNSLASSKSLFGNRFSLCGWAVKWVSTHWARATKSKRTNSQSIPFVLFYIHFSFLGCLSITQQCPVYTVVSSPDRVHSVVFSKKTVCQAMQGNMWWTSIPSQRDQQYPLSPHPKENEMTFDGGRFTISVTELFSNSLTYSLLISLYRNYTSFPRN